MNYGPRNPGIPQHWLRIPMPWTAIYYDINRDELTKGRKLLVGTWFIENKCFMFRLGWSYRFTYVQEMENHSMVLRSKRTE